MNVGSGPQIRQLLFAGVANANSGPDKKEEFLELERVFKASHPPWSQMTSGWLCMARVTGQAVPWQCLRRLLVLGWPRCKLAFRGGAWLSSVVPE